jgi:hypothetical protein
MDSEETMSGFDCYKTYLAVQQHFTRDSYDYFKYNGQVRANETSYISRKDKYFFEKASRKYKRDKFVKFLVAHYTTGSKPWIGNMMSSDSLGLLTNWNRKIETLSYMFSEEMDYLYNVEESFDELFVMRDGSHPLLYRHYAQNKISLETLVLLDQLLGYTNRWKKYDDIVLNETVTLVRKYSPFVREFSPIDKSKLKSIVLKIY